MRALDIANQWLARLGPPPFDPGSDRLFDSDRGGFVFLSPHSDDICFSLGAFALRQNAGTLLNIFSTSGNIARIEMAPEFLTTRSPAGFPAAPSLGTPRSEAADAWVTWVSQLRRAEDQAFANACGLAILDLQLPEAPLRGQDPFQAPTREKDLALLETALMPALADLAPRHGRRPWLFCPAGFGGHVDHGLVRDMVLKQFKVLQTIYRIAFYEDMHYASRRLQRWRGLAAFRSGAKALELRRLRLPMHDDPARKLRLVQSYASQLTPDLMRIERYSAPCLFPGGLHEAIWIPQGSERV